MIDLMVIGGGAAGFFSAIHHCGAFPGEDVVLVEKSSDVLTKVKISGGGRCNVTHSCFDPRVLCEHYPRGSRELLGAFHRFGPQDTIDWFLSRGVRLKTEDDGRMFPVSNRSQSIVDCLETAAQSAGVRVWMQCGVKTIKKVQDHFEVYLDNGQNHSCRKIILATGSNRSGHRLAEALGHRIVAPVPSLFTFKIGDSGLHQLSGLSVERTVATLSLDKKQRQHGAILITHWGLSGPVIIKLSAWHARSLFNCNYRCQISINWLADYDVTQLSDRFKKMMKRSPKKILSTTSPFTEIPQRLWAYLLKKIQVPPALTWQQITPKHIDQLSDGLLNCVFTVNGKGVFKEEFVTCGGVSLKEINFKTMESKVCPGLFVVGEALDIDGVTGGFNFQNAWTTGMIAGTSAV